MLVFSDLPDVSVEQAIIDGLLMAKITPPSLLSGLDNIERLISYQSPDAMKRFSFLSANTTIVGRISWLNVEQMRPLSVLLDGRSFELYLI